MASSSSCSISTAASRSIRARCASRCFALGGPPDLPLAGPPIRCSARTLVRRSSRNRSGKPVAAATATAHSRVLAACGPSLPSALRGRPTTRPSARCSAARRATTRASSSTLRARLSVASGSAECVSHLAQGHADAPLTKVDAQDPPGSLGARATAAVVAAHGVAVALAPAEAVASGVGVGLGDGVLGRRAASARRSAPPPRSAGGSGRRGRSVGVAVRTGAGGAAVVAAGGAVGMISRTSIRKSNPEIVDTQNGERETCASPYCDR